MRGSDIISAGPMKMAEDQYQEANSAKDDRGREELQETAPLKRR